VSGRAFALRIAVAIGVLAVVATRPTPPSFDAVRAAFQPSDAALVDRHGNLLATRRIDPTRRRLRWVALGDVSPQLRAAVVAAEDRRFAEHGGVDLRALAAAVVQRLTGGGRRGASTITMQVAALLDPTLRPAGARTLGQKWRQMRLAFALERRWTKDEILEAYLNLASFRGEREGIGAATAGLLGKTPDGVTEPEALLLAALLASPNAPATAVDRRAVAIRNALHDSTPPEVLSATVTRMLGARPEPLASSSLAPHVARRLLTSGTDRRTVTATLDAAIQRDALASLRRNLLAVRARGVDDGAVLVVDNESGDVLAYVGSSGDLSSAFEVDGVVARRQPGSTLKPFLYGLAIEQRLLTPGTLLEDAPLELGVAEGLYRPRNYDDAFRGLVSVRTALASSLNTPAVRTLELVGGDAFVARLRAAGFAGIDRAAAYYGPSLALGSADVSLWELVGAYRTLANGGRFTPLRLEPIASATEPQRVFTDATAFLVADILADRESRSPTFGLENVLATRFWTAVKTGTSKDMRDNWCVGFSRRYTVGVWVGNFSGHPMRDVSGVTGAAPIWMELMERLHRDVPSERPAPPPGVIAASIAFPDDVEPPRREWTLAGTDAPVERTALAQRRPHIKAPVSGTRIALDPDVPPGRQRLLLEAEGAEPPWRWRLDGTDLGGAAPSLWEPTAGHHVLELVDAGGSVQDGVAFDVRGRAPR
jgi:penicillin-binding protein 1C